MLNHKAKPFVPSSLQILSSSQQRKKDTVLEWALLYAVVRALANNDLETRVDIAALQAVLYHRHTNLCHRALNGRSLYCFLCKYPTVVALYGDKKVRLAGKLRSTDANAEAETVAAVLQMLRARPPFYSCALDDILVAARGQSAGLDRTELCCALRRRAETFVCDGRTVALREFPASDGGLVPQTDDFGGASSDHLVVQIEELLSFDDCCTSNACS